MIIPLLPFFLPLPLILSHPPPLSFKWDDWTQDKYLFLQIILLVKGNVKNRDRQNFIRYNKMKFLTNNFWRASIFHLIFNSAGLCGKCSCNPLLDDVLVHNLEVDKSYIFVDHFSHKKAQSPSPLSSVHIIPPPTAEYFASGGHSGLLEIYFYEVHISRTYK